MAFDPGDAVSRSLKMMDQFYVAMMQCNILRIQSFQYECYSAISEESYLKFCDQLILLANEVQQIRDYVFNSQKSSVGCQTDLLNITTTTTTPIPRKPHPVSVPQKCIKIEKPMIAATDEEDCQQGNKRSPNKRDILTCDYCELKFNSLEKMQQHVNISHSEDFTSTFYPCQNCSLIFLSLEELNEHSFCVHNAPEDKKENEDQLCPYCCQVNSNWFDYILHLEEQHQTLVCKTCHTFCSDLETLKEHIKKSHMTGITKENIKDIVVPVMEPKPVSRVPVNKRPFDDVPVARKRGRPKGSTLFSKLDDVEIVKCHFCNARFNNEDSLRKHIVYKHDTGELECVECNLKFKRSSAFENHMRLFHKKAKEVKSSFAKSSSSDKDSTSEKGKLNTSLQKVYVKAPKKEDAKKPLSLVSTPKGQMKPSCEICGEMCNRIEDQEIHKDFHTTLVPDKFLCLFCKEPAMPQKELRTHIMSEHRYRCPFCALTFWWKTNLESHLKQLHRTKNCCIMCGLNLEGEQLRQHIVENHTVKKCYICKICEAEHSTVKEMREHEKSHAIDPLQPPTCDFCHSVYGRKKSLRGHILRHIFGSFSCSLCGLQCKTEDELKLHMGGHQKSQYACMCGEYFQTKADLQMHQKVTPCKPFFNQPIHRADLFVEVLIEETDQSLPVEAPATVTRLETQGLTSEDIYHINIAEVPAQGSKNFLDSLAAVNKSNQLVMPRQPILILNTDGAEATLIENKSPGIMSWVENVDTGDDLPAVE